MGDQSPLERDLQCRGTWMGKALRILIVEDSAADAELIVRELGRAAIACEATRVETRADLVRQLADFPPDIILSDFKLPAFDGLSALQIAQEKRPATPFIFVSGTIGEERAIESLKRGATDYVLKTNLARLPSAVERAIHEATARVERQKQERKLAHLGRIHVVLSGINSAIVRVRDRQELFQEACAVAVEQGAFRLAWIGLAESGAAKLKPVAWRGYDEGYLDAVRLPLAFVTEDEGIGGQALRHRKMVIANDIENDPKVLFKKEALARGYRSLAALPLLVAGEVYAVFLLYAAEPEFFNEDELKLLGELAGDISFALEYIEKEEKLHYLAYHDALTGSANRNLLRDRLNQAITHSRRHGSMTAVAFVDLDRFKLINDGLGHDVGDMVLKTVARRLSSCMREGDTVGRHGGDEFVLVLLDQQNLETTSQVMQRILAAVSEPIALEDRDFSVTCSIGISIYPQDGTDTETLLKNADSAMYRAKDTGQNNFQFYAREMNARISERATPGSSAA